MTTEITKNLMCILMRSGVEVWLEEEKMNDLLSLLAKERFIKINGQIINSADVSGVFDAITMQENWYRKNGYWKCKKANYWHKKGEECGHK